MTKRKIIERQALVFCLMAAVAAGCSEPAPPAHEVTFEGKVSDIFDVDMTLYWDSIPGKVKSVYKSGFIAMYDELTLEGNIAADSTMVLTGDNSCNLMFPDGNQHFEQKDEWKLRLYKAGGDSLVLTGEMSSDGAINGRVRLVGKND